MRCNYVRTMVEALKRKYDLFCFGTPVFFTPQVTNYLLFYSTLLSKKTRAPDRLKKYKLIKVGGGEQTE